jgi:hypothetical protein
MLWETAARDLPGRRASQERYAGPVARSTTLDRKATAAEVTAHRQAIRDGAERLGLSDLRLRGDGTVVVHTTEPGYRAVIRLSAAVSEVVGTYVHVITDDVPGAIDAREL